MQGKHGGFRGVESTAKHRVVVGNYSLLRLIPKMLGSQDQQPTVDKYLHVGVNSAQHVQSSCGAEGSGNANQ